MHQCVLRRIALIILCVAGVSGTAYAADLHVGSPWVRGTVAGQKATGAFMELSSKAGTTVVGASSPVAGVTEIHEMKMDGQAMQMRATPRLTVPAGKPLSLAPGGYHVMLMDLKQPLTPGEIVPITLQLEGADKKRETVEVKAEVRALTTAPAANSHGGMKH